MSDAATNPDLGALRRTLGESSDPRPARTREAILAAVSRLAAETPDSLTVSDIVRSAEVSRSSFYAHFEGLEDVAAHLQRRAFQSIADEEHDERLAGDADGLAAMRHSQQRLVGHYVENRALYAAVLNLPLSHVTHMRSAYAMSAIIEARMRELPSLPVEIDAAIAATYVANAAVGILTAWVRGDIEASPDALVEHLLALMPAWLRTPDVPA